MMRRLTWWLSPLVLFMALGAPSPAKGADTLAGSQGTDTSLPLTDSAVTVSGRGPFADLRITINQTSQLTNQAVSITWSGGTPTRQGPGRFAGHYLQIMQCWGDPDGTNAANPGPPPEQCVMGATGGRYEGPPSGLFSSPNAIDRAISRTTWDNFDPNVGVVDERTGIVWRPFRAVDGTEVAAQFDPNFNPDVVGGNFWLNAYYNLTTTNEIAGAPTGRDGRGAELFQVNTGVQSTGLGCGQQVQRLADGTTKVPQCWIVVVPRGAPADENVGTPFGATPDQWGVVTSPLAPTSWQHRIAIPIESNPVDSPCELSRGERRISGSELALPAIASWQPALCSNADLPPYSFAPVADPSARQQLSFGGAGAPGMVIVPRPVTGSLKKESNPIVYAPLTASGVVIGFNVERFPLPDAPPEQQALTGVRVADVNLTPRLVAKLLTQSYRGQVAVGGVLPRDGYEWARTNPYHIVLDPDFVQFNPEFAQLQGGDIRTMGGLLLPTGASDAAQMMWEWVLADPEAKLWLDGQPDPSGMTVNPMYATVAAANKTGIAFGTPAPNSFPKSDPYCYQAPPIGVRQVVPPQLCGTDWLPYTRGFSDSAQMVRSASVGARVVENPFAQSQAEAWTREPPQTIGRKAMLAVTDTPSAAQFGLQTARLSRAGDDGAVRTFIAPDEAGLRAGLAAMVAGPEAGVLEPSPTADAPAAYPLTTVTYGAVAPLPLDVTARNQYATFIEYAAGAGQVAGYALGQLPPGYVPLPEEMRAQAVAAAALVRTLVAPDSTTTTTTTTTTVASARDIEPTDGGGAASVFSSSGPTQRSSGGSGSSGGGSSTASGTTTTGTTTTTSTTPEPAPTSAPPESSVPPPTESTPPSTDAEPAPSSSAPQMLTPATGVAFPARYAVAGLSAAALVSAFLALEITKRPRRVLAPGAPGTADVGFALIDDANEGVV